MSDKNANLESTMEYFSFGYYELLERFYGESFQARFPNEKATLEQITAGLRDEKKRKEYRAFLDACLKRNEEAFRVRAQKRLEELNFYEKNMVSIPVSKVYLQKVSEKVQAMVQNGKNFDFEHHKMLTYFSYSMADLLTHYKFSSIKDTEHGKVILSYLTKCAEAKDIEKMPFHDLVLACYEAGRNGNPKDLFTFCDALKQLESNGDAFFRILSENIHTFASYQRGKSALEAQKEAFCAVLKDMGLQQESLAFRQVVMEKNASLAMELASLLLESPLATTPDMDDRTKENLAILNGFSQMKNKDSSIIKDSLSLEHTSYVKLEKDYDRVAPFIVKERDLKEKEDLNREQMTGFLYQYLKKQGFSCEYDVLRQELDDKNKAEEYVQLLISDYLSEEKRTTKSDIVLIAYFTDACKHLHGLHYDNIKPRSQENKTFIKGVEDVTKQAVEVEMFLERTDVSNLDFSSEKESRSISFADGIRVDYGKQYDNHPFILMNHIKDDMEILFDETDLELAGVSVSRFVTDKLMTKAGREELLVLLSNKYAELKTLNISQNASLETDKTLLSNIIDMVVAMHNPAKVKEDLSMKLDMDDVVKAVVLERQAMPYTLLQEDVIQDFMKEASSYDNKTAEESSKDGTKTKGQAGETGKESDSPKEEKKQKKTPPLYQLRFYVPDDKKPVIFRANTKEEAFEKVQTYVKDKNIEFSAEEKFYPIVYLDTYDSKQKCYFGNNDNKFDLFTGEKKTRYMEYVRNENKPKAKSSKQQQGNTKNTNDKNQKGKKKVNKNCQAEER